MEITDRDGLNNDLKKFILDYQNRHPRLSFTRIAKRMNVDHDSLKRLVNGEGKPDISMMANILIHTGHRDKLADFLKKADPDLANAFVESFSHNYEVPFLKEDYGEYFTIKEYLLILMQAYTQNGTSYREIKDRYGKEGEDRLRELLQKKVLKEWKGRIFGVEKKATYSQKKLHKTLQILMESSYDPLLFGKNKNWLSLQTESVNRKRAIPAIRKVLQQAYSDVREILYAKEYQGEEVFFIGMVFDQINKQE